MAKKIIKILLIILLIAIIASYILPLAVPALAVYSIGSFISRDESSVSYSEAQINEIKQMVKLNSLQAQEDIVFKDTIDNMYVVYDIDVNIVIGFDVDNLRYKVINNRLVVELPQPKVSIYQNGKEQLLDIYELTLSGKIHEWTNIGYSPNLSGTQSMRLHGKIAKYIEDFVARKHYENKAREMALHNLANLFYALQGDVTIVESIAQYEASTIVDDRPVITMPQE